VHSCSKCVASALTAKNSVTVLCSTFVNEQSVAFCGFLIHLICLHDIVVYEKVWQMNRCTRITHIQRPKLINMVHAVLSISWPRRQNFQECVHQVSNMPDSRRSFLAPAITYNELQQIICNINAYPANMENIVIS